jgi:S1 RNA binding domain protein
MELAVGTIVSGKVTTITKFGAFVSLPDGKSGLVHISEVANSFVNDVHDFLAEGQAVSVKVLAITPEGKINLSIKQTQPPQPRGNRGGLRPKQDRPAQDRPFHGRAPRSAPPQSSAAPPAELSFEDKLKQFMSASDSKQSELNRYMQGKRGRRRR